LCSIRWPSAHLHDSPSWLQLHHIARYHPGSTTRRHTTDMKKIIQGALKRRRATSDVAPSPPRPGPTKRPESFMHHNLAQASGTQAIHSLGSQMWCLRAGYSWSTKLTVSVHRSPYGRTPRGCTVTSANMAPCPHPRATPTFPKPTNIAGWRARTPGPCSAGPVRRNLLQLVSTCQRNSPSNWCCDR
jgi:hypothetical protein